MSDGCGVCASHLSTHTESDNKKNLCTLLFVIWKVHALTLCSISCKGVSEFETRWIGWAGVNVSDEVGKKALTRALAEQVSS